MSLDKHVTGSAAKNPRWPPPPSWFYINGCRFVATFLIITKFCTYIDSAFRHKKSKYYYKKMAKPFKPSCYRRYRSKKAKIKSYSNETAAIYVKSRWRRRPSWIFVRYFRFLNFSIEHDTMYLCFKFHQYRSIFGRVIAKSVFSRWPPPPSCFFDFYFRLANLSVSGWFACTLKKWRWSVHRFKFYDTFRSKPLIMGNPYTRPKLGGFWGKRPPNF